MERAKSGAFSPCASSHQKRSEIQVALDSFAAEIHDSRGNSCRHGISVPERDCNCVSLAPAIRVELCRGRCYWELHALCKHWRLANSGHGLCAAALKKTECWTVVPPAGRLFLLVLDRWPLRVYNCIAKQRAAMLMISHVSDKLLL